jgi:hypothetical protein
VWSPGSVYLTGGTAAGESKTDDTRTGTVLTSTSTLDLPDAVLPLHPVREHLGPDCHLGRWAGRDGALRTWPVAGDERAGSRGPPVR